MGRARGYGPPVFALSKLRIACVWVLLSAVGVLAAACGEERQDATPTGALVMFLEAMEQGENDSASLQRAFQLLDPVARKGLEARAQKAQSLAGRPYDAWEMLAEGRFRMRFTPARHRMRAKVDGDRAKVSVSDAAGKQTVHVPMVLEDGAWRVVLELPPMYQPPPVGT